jgi:hypothetical protein
MESVATPAALPAPYRPDAPPADAVSHLADRYRRANRGVMAIFNALGGSLEGQIEALPQPVRQRLMQGTRAALEAGYGLARSVPELRPMGRRSAVAIASLSGAVGGAGGLATSIAELPLTITLILRAVQDVARGHGFDPATEGVRRETLRVFGAGSPLARDDGVDTTFIAARLTFTGPAVQAMLAGVAPRLAAAMGPKLAAQSVPVLGALAGAGLNAAYMDYYREMAQVRFGLLALAASHDPARVLGAFRAAAGGPAPARR